MMRLTASHALQWIAAGALVLSVLWMASCERGTRATVKRAGPVRIVVGVPPLVGLVKALAPADAAVRSLVPPGRSAHGYELTPADLADLGQADVLIYVGLGIDGSLERFATQRTSQGTAVLSVSRLTGVEPAAADGHGHDHDHAHDHGHDHDDHAGHDHGDGHEGHNHGPVDPHLWLDPVLMGKLVDPMKSAIADAMKSRGRLDAAEQARLDQAAKDLSVRLADMDRRYRDQLAPLQGVAIVTHHDSFRRIADRYGLKVAAVIRAIESGEPTPGALAQAVESIRKQGARAVFFEPQYDKAIAQRIATAAGVKLAPLDPETREDWFALMEENLQSLVVNLSAPPPVAAPHPSASPSSPQPIPAPPR